MNRDIKGLILGAISIFGGPLLCILLLRAIGSFPLVIVVAMCFAFCSIPSLHFASRPWKRNWTRRRLIGFIFGVLGTVWLGFLVAFFIWFVFFAPAW